MDGRARLWLAVGTVAVLAGVALWQVVPATQRDAPGKAAQAAQVPAAAEVRAHGTVARPTPALPK